MADDVVSITTGDHIVVIDVRKYHKKIVAEAYYYVIIITRVTCLILNRLQKV